MPWEKCLVNNIPTLSCLPVILNNVIVALITLAGIVAIFFIIHSGFKLITSCGNPKQVEVAKSALVYAILGLFLVFLSFAIINIISEATNVKCIKTIGFEC